MKTAMKKYRVIFRLGITGATLLFAQQALAVGTLATTPVDNMATVNYEVSNTPQTEIESSPTGNSTPGANGTVTQFLVDNRVNFTLVVQDITQTIVAPGGADAVTEFLLTNLGNSVQDFNTTVLPLPSVPASDVFGQSDDSDMAALTVAVDDGDGIPEIGGDDFRTFVDELGPDLSLTVWVAGDAGLLMVDGNIANIELTATVADGSTPGVLGPDTTNDFGAADLPGTVQVVFANGVAPGALGDGIEEDRSGYEIQSAALAVTKTSLVLSDPFNLLVDPKAIPGAVVQYTVLVANTGAVAATDVVITDTIQTPEVAVALGGYGGAGLDIQITVGAAPSSTCSADLDATDACTFDVVSPDTFSIGRTGVGGLTIPLGETATILYQVTIQ